jgi:hypothetical protein
MNFQKTFFFTLAFAFICLFWAFKPTQTQQKYSYMQITTIESVVPAGLGRSRMFITNPTGQNTEINMENLYTMVGINMKNIQSNDRLILDNINRLSTDSWEVAQVTSGVQSSSDGGNGIFMTRYLLKKSVD